MEDKRKIEKWKIVLLFTLSCTVIPLLLLRNNSDSKIRNKHLIVCGKILSVNNNRIGYIIKLEFNYNKNEKIISSATCTYETKEKFKSGIKEILIAYEKRNPFNFNILENKKDFDKFNIVREDTLGINCDCETE